MAASVLDLTDKLWTGEVTVGEVHPVGGHRGPRRGGATAIGFVASFGNVAAFATDDGLVLVDTGNQVLAGTQPRGRPGVDRPAARHRRLHPRPHRPRLRPGAVRGGGEARTGGRGPGCVAHEAVPARFDRYMLTAGLQRRHQRPAVQDAGLPVADRVPLPRRDLPRCATTSTSAASASSCTTARARPTTTPGCGCPTARSLCTGDLFIWASPNCGNPQKVQRYPREWARRPARDGGARPELLLPGPRLADRRAPTASSRRSATPPTLLDHLVDADAGADERGRPPRRHRPHRAGARPSCSSGPTCARSTTSPSSSSATCGGCTAAGTTATPPTSSRRPTPRWPPSWPRWPAAPACLADRAAALAADGDLRLAGPPGRAGGPGRARRRRRPPGAGRGVRASGRARSCRRCRRACSRGRPTSRRPASASSATDSPSLAVGSPSGHVDASARRAGRPQVVGELGEGTRALSPLVDGMT